LRIAFQIGNGGRLDDNLAAAPHELAQPAMALQALIDAQRRLVQPRLERQHRRAVRPEDVDVHGLAGLRRIVPEVDLELALDRARLAEDDGRRRDLPMEDLLRAAVGDEGDPVAVLQQANAEQQAGLTGSDDDDVTHVRSFF
jgi:hypothetical protein